MTTTTPEIHPPRRIAYEWVLTMHGGKETILTENQYAVYKAHEKAGGGKIYFDDVEINPSYMIIADRREAQYVRRKYPCSKCGSTGRNPDNTGWCLNCRGSGVELPKR